MQPHTKACLYLPSDGLKLSEESVQLLIKMGKLKPRKVKALQPWRYGGVGFVYI